MRTVTVGGMTCAHCKARVEKAVRALGVDCEVDLASGTAKISGSIDAAAVKQAVEDAGYEVISIE